ncbi:hypothetical protein GIG_01920 [Mycoplasmopsis anatis 1340]|uniref:Uncharacterized protein n=1 Tax=Mycoplasmopsis anatis 1340 TaxID=1034808 RepID=F9QD78_9BACT|nr:hypothetical protein GIG_01920 [Mycoplasmopsis anatis 1340]
MDFVISLVNVKTDDDKNTRIVSPVIVTLFLERDLSVSLNKFFIILL